MAMEKSIKIQKNKVLTYSVNKDGFKTVYGSTIVSENQTINVEMKNLSSESEPFQLGDRLFGISTFVDYFTPDTENVNCLDKDSLKYISATQTTGTGLTDIQVIKGTSTTPASEETGTWLSKVERDLQIVTPKGSSSTFVFTYNGSTWDITGALTLSGQDKDDYGISFDGTATSGDVITVVETQYNKFAFFVLDANYRSNQQWASVDERIMRKQYGSNPQDCLESATYYNQYIFDNANLSNYIAFNYCKNLGTFILGNGIKITPLVPNGKELLLIYNNSRDANTGLDSFDPVIQGGSTSYNLTNWNFNRSHAWCCLEYDADEAWFFDSYGYFGHGASYLDLKVGGSLGIIPIFEVPVM